MLTRVLLKHILSYQCAQLRNLLKGITVNRHGCLCALLCRGSQDVDATLPSGRKVVRPAFTYLTPDLQSLTDIVRAVTPLGWARFITMTYGNYPYRGASNAAYGEQTHAMSEQTLLVSALIGARSQKPIGRLLTLLHHALLVWSHSQLHQPA